MSFVSLGSFLYVKFVQHGFGLLFIEAMHHVLHRYNENKGMQDNKTQCKVKQRNIALEL